MVMHLQWCRLTIESKPFGALGTLYTEYVLYCTVQLYCTVLVRVLLSNDTPHFDLKCSCCKTCKTYIRLYSFYNIPGILTILSYHVILEPGILCIILNNY